MRSRTAGGWGWRGNNAEHGCGISNSFFASIHLGHTANSGSPCRLQAADANPSAPLLHHYMSRPCCWFVGGTAGVNSTRSDLSNKQHYLNSQRAAPWSWSFCDTPSSEFVDMVSTRRHKRADGATHGPGCSGVGQMAGESYPLVRTSKKPTSCRAAWLTP